jgi:hypothetical protein
MWNRLRRFSALPPHARLLFVRAAVLLPAVALSLKVRGFLTTQKSLQKSARPASLQSDASAWADQQPGWCVRMVNAAARELWPMSTCLERSLVLWQLLGRSGIVSAVRIGARKVDGDFEAHAWVERNGEPLNDREFAHRHYAAFEAAFPLRLEIS